MRSLHVAFWIAATLAIAGQFAGWDWLHWLTKPTATAIALAMVLPVGGAYARAIALGLAFAIGGDVFLMLPGDYFLFGLICFLLTHLAYIFALTRQVRFAARPAVFAGFALIAGLIVALLWPGVPAPMRGPVIGYALVISAMAAQAVTRGLNAPSPSAKLALWGSLFFLVSDTILAFNRFRTPVPASPLLVLGTYYAAQYLFAVSALASGRRAR